MFSANHFIWLGLCGIFVAGMLYVNSILSVYGTNFMFLVRPPMENLPVILSERKCGKVAQ